MFSCSWVFFTCMGTHVADRGGAQAASRFLAFDHIAEGLNIPLIKVAENDQYREGVLELILANNRLPDTTRREMASLMGSTAAGERMVEFLNKYGKDTVMDSVDQVAGMMNCYEKETGRIYVHTSFRAAAGAVAGNDGYQCVRDIRTLGVVGKTEGREKTSIIDILKTHRPLKVKSGDHLVTPSGSGAGDGKPEERDSEAVKDDDRNELVFVQMAHDVYKVVSDPNTFAVDQAATAKLRKAS